MRGNREGVKDPNYTKKSKAKGGTGEKTIKGKRGRRQVCKSLQPNKEAKQFKITIYFLDYLKTMVFLKNFMKICHCAHCSIEPECADNNWCLYNENDPCCPNWKKGHKQFRQFLIDEGYIKKDQLRNQ